jgi:hypothetical protein
VYFKHCRQQINKKGEVAAVIAKRAKVNWLMIRSGDMSLVSLDMTHKSDTSQDQMCTSENHEELQTFCVTAHKPSVMNLYLFVNRSWVDTRWQ